MSKPLAGRTIIITRPQKSSGGAAAELEGRGARIIVCPLIRVVAPRSFGPLDRALESFSRFDVIVFTSVNAVHFFFLRSRKILGRAPVHPRVIAAVGAATAKAVARHGWRCSVAPEDARAAGLARVLRVPRGSRVLIPRAERGLDLLPRALRAAGARVTVVPAYRTLPDAAGRRAYRRALALGADAVLFASGSAAALGAADAKLSGAAAVAIGPTTAAVLRSRGLPCETARRPDPAALARAAVRALRSRP